MLKGERLIFNRKLPTENCQLKTETTDKKVSARSEEPYLDQELSLRSLAAQVELHPNQLSWLLNERLNKNFNEFVNHYRVQAFKKLALDPANAQVTLLGLAYDSGFSSKTVFNTYFKKETGRTPKQFLNEQQE